MKYLARPLAVLALGALTGLIAVSAEEPATSGTMCVVRYSFSTRSSPPMTFTSCLATDDSSSSGATKRVSTASA